MISEYKFSNHRILGKLQNAVIFYVLSCRLYKRLRAYLSFIVIFYKYIFALLTYHIDGDIVSYTSN